MMRPNSTGRHRQSRPPILGTALMVIVTMVLGALLLHIKPDQAQVQRPFVRDGVTGRPVSARTFDVTVLDVTGGPLLVQPGDKLDTGGIWIAVRVRVVAVDKPLEIGYSEVRDGQSRTFSPSRRVKQPLTDGRTLQPGLPLEAQIVFEMPPASAGDLTLLMAKPPKDSLSGLGLAMEAVVSIPLPVDRAKVDGWMAAKATVTVDKAKVG